MDRSQRRVAAALAMASVLVAYSIAAPAAPKDLGRDAAYTANRHLSSDPLVMLALKRRCPDILANPAEYDEDVIALCLKARIGE